MSIITLTTDFGTTDPYAGIMKGVILGINSNVDVVDLTHNLPAHSIEAAAFSLFSSVPWFPEGTIHLAVVDPGVGSDRPMIVVKTEKYFIVAPDNGIASYCIERESSSEIRKIENRRYMAPEISCTFHGRDVMAPAAAYLSKGIAFESIGPVVKKIITLPSYKPLIDADAIKGRIIRVDHFGNMTTNISVKDVRSIGEPFLIRAGSVSIDHISPSYASAESGAVLAIEGSSGFIEIAANQSDAASKTGLAAGNRVTVNRLF